MKLITSPMCRFEFWKKSGRRSHGCHVISGECALVSDTLEVNPAVLLIRF